LKTNICIWIRRHFTVGNAVHERLIVAVYTVRVNELPGMVGIVSALLEPNREEMVVGAI